MAHSNNNAPSNGKGKFQGGLYPTVAVSDAFMAGCNFWAAQTLFAAGAEPQALGFLMVAVAASAGVLRFGVSESLFAASNTKLAVLAGLVGLPLAGATLLAKLFPGVPFLAQSPLAIAVGLSLVERLASQFPEGIREAIKVLVNVGCFLFPVGMLAYRQNDVVLGAGLALFGLAGVVVGPDRHRFIFGVRRENLFHYGLGLATVLMVARLRVLL
jgi:hypothetical protein